MVLLTVCQLHWLVESIDHTTERPVAHMGRLLVQFALFRTLVYTFVSETCENYLAPPVVCKLFW